MGRGRKSRGISSRLRLGTAYSRRASEVGAAGGEDQEDTAVVIGGHPRRKVGRGFLRRLSLVAAPFHAQAIGQSRQDAMHPHGVARAQTTFIVAPRYVQARVEPGLDTPRLPVAQQPRRRRQSRRRQAGQQGHRFGGAPYYVPPEPRGLRGQREADRFGGDGGADQRTAFIPAPVALDGARQRSDRLRGEGLPAGPARAAQCFRLPWVDCL